MTDKNHYSDEILAVCAVNATLKTDGVRGMAGGMADAFSKNLLRRENAAKGTKINRSGEETAVDVSVIVDYGCNIPTVAWDIQENVKNELRDMVNIDVTEVNIHVQGVGMTEGEGTAPQSRGELLASADELPPVPYVNPNVGESLSGGSSGGTAAAEQNPPAGKGL